MQLRDPTLELFHQVHWLYSARFHPENIQLKHHFRRTLGHQDVKPRLSASHRLKFERMVMVCQLHARLPRHPSRLIHPRGEFFIVVQRGALPSLQIRNHQMRQPMPPGFVHRFLKVGHGRIRRCHYRIPVEMHRVHGHTIVFGRFDHVSRLR